jgi:GNAT superfamily N-acetyltransferase
MRLSSSIAKRLLPRMRRYLGMNCLRVLQYECGEGGGIPRSQRNAECRVLSEDEVLAFAADPELELDEQWVRGAFARGAVCLGAVDNGRLLGYTWLAFCDTPYTSGVWIHLDPAMRYLHKSFVRPGYRGQRIIHALHAFADRPDLWRGRHASINFVDVDNFASLAALQRVGSRTLGYATYARIFGTVIAFRSPGLRRAGIDLYAQPARRIADRMRAWADPDRQSSA